MFVVLPSRQLEEMLKRQSWKKGCKPTRMSTLTDQMVITFEDEDCADIKDPHHDGLVITQYVAICSQDTCGWRKFGEHHPTRNLEKDEYA